jgi:cytochrome c peroxidase
MRRFRVLFVIITVIFSLAYCTKRTTQVGVLYHPVPYKLKIPQGFPYMGLASDNPETVEGIQLGRMLFYDPIIDKESERACGNCHTPKASFSLQKENSLPQVNLVWNNTFLWNGKVEGLLEQIMIFEVDSFFKTDLNKLNSHKKYPKLFKMAFGVEKITSKEVGYALAQFERILISCNSKYDKYLRGEVILSNEEENGRILYFTEKGDCFHCHGTILLTDNTFHNNGLDSLPAKGRFEITRDRNDLGKFKTPTLRNIELTSPYMHDRRFQTLEEVINFYCEKVKWSPTIDPLMKKVKKGGIRLNEEERKNLLAFLKTFTDTTFINNPEFSDPFKAGKIK